MKLRMWTWILGTLLFVSACAAIEEEPVIDEEVVADEERIDQLAGDRSVESLAGAPGEAQSAPLPYCHNYDLMPCPPRSRPRVCWLQLTSEPGICYCSASSGLWECS